MRENCQYGSMRRDAVNSCPLLYRVRVCLQTGMPLRETAKWLAQGGTTGGILKEAIPYRPNAAIAVLLSHPPGWGGTGRQLRCASWAGPFWPSTILPALLATGCALSAGVCQFEDTP